MRKLLAILFLLVFSLQVLPVKAIGKLLSKQQTEEDVKHSCDNADKDDLNNTGKYLDLIDHSFENFTAERFVALNKVAKHCYDDDLPTAHIADIPSPPPNC